MQTTELNPKRMELLAGAAPAAGTIGLPVHPSNIRRPDVINVKAAEAPGPAAAPAPLAFADEIKA